MSANYLLSVQNLMITTNAIKVTILSSYPKYVSGHYLTEKISPEYVFDNLIFKVKLQYIEVPMSYNTLRMLLIYVSFKKVKKGNSVHNIEFSSPELNITRETFTSNNGEWIQISIKNYWSLPSFQVEAKFKILPRYVGFGCLHDDTELTDFQLKGDDGSVQVHKAVLAAHSPVMRRMLTGEWRETNEGHIKIPGIPMTSLQHFKDYMYQHTLPESGLDHLALLGKQYMMPDLCRRISNKVVDILTAENVIDWLEFAFTHKIRELQMDLLQCIQGKAIKICDIQKCLGLDNVEQNTEEKDEEEDDEEDEEEEEDY